MGQCVVCTEERHANKGGDGFGWVPWVVALWIGYQIYQQGGLSTTLGPATSLPIASGCPLPPLQ